MAKLPAIQGIGGMSAYASLSRRYFSAGCGSPVVAQARIRVRLRQVQAGNFGDVEPVGDGVSELRIHVGAGYRVYCARHGKAVVILLCGGDKGSQSADIKRAKEFWLE